MLTRVIKKAFCLTVRGTSLPQKTVHSVEDIYDKAERIELALIIDHHIPHFSKEIDSIDSIRKVTDYN